MVHILNDLSNYHIYYCFTLSQQLSGKNWLTVPKIKHYVPFLTFFFQSHFELVKLQETEGRDKELSKLCLVFHFSFLALINHYRVLPHAGRKKCFLFIKIIVAWMFLYSQTLTYFFSKLQCPYVKWKPYALSCARFFARGNVFE